MNIGKRMSLVRQSMGLTIEQVSEMISNKSYDRIETGRVALKWDVLEKFCLALQFPIWELCAETLNVQYQEVSAQEQFSDLLSELKILGAHIRVEKDGFASGSIEYMTFRLFREEEMSYVCIADGTEKGTKWPAFYTPDDLLRWYKSKGEHENPMP